MVETKPNIYDGLEDWASSSEHIPVETAVKIKGANKKIDLAEESKQGALAGVVNKFIEDGKHVGISLGRVPNEVRVFVAKHPHLIIATVTATASAILLLEAKKIVHKKKK